jgi:putative membrane protein
MNLKLLIALVLNALALILTSKIVPGIMVTDFTVAILAAIVLGVINTFIKPILVLLTAPINILTLGLFTFVINAVVLYLVSLVVPGFGVSGALAAILGAIVLSVVSTVLSTVVGEVKKVA